MKNYRPERAAKDPKPKKLFECGYVEKVRTSNGIEYVRCTALTSKQFPINNGKIYLCPNHEKHSQ